MNPIMETSTACEPKSVGTKERGVSKVPLTYLHLSNESDETQPGRRDYKEGRDILMRTNSNPGTVHLHRGPEDLGTARQAGTV